MLTGTVRLQRERERIGKCAIKNAFSECESESESEKERKGNSREYINLPLNRHHLMTLFLASEMGILCFALHSSNAACGRSKRSAHS